VRPPRRAAGVGITDHGNMYGALEPTRKPRRKRQPVLGMEGYFSEHARFSRPKRADNEIFHLTMVAENNVGYHNLVKVASAAFLDGYYYKPRSDWELLEQYQRGIIATTGCSAASSASWCWPINSRRRTTAARASRTSSPRQLLRRDPRPRHRGPKSARSVRCSTSRASCARRGSPPTTRITPHKADADAHDALLVRADRVAQERHEAPQSSTAKTSNIKSSAEMRGPVRRAA